MYKIGDIDFFKEYNKNKFVIKHYIFEEYNNGKLVLEKLVNTLNEAIFYYEASNSQTRRIYAKIKGYGKIDLTGKLVKSVYIENSNGKEFYDSFIEAYKYSELDSNSKLYAEIENVGVVLFEE